MICQMVSREMLSPYEEATARSEQSRAWIAHMRTGNSTVVVDPGGSFSPWRTSPIHSEYGGPTHTAQTVVVRLNPMSALFFVEKP